MQSLKPHPYVPTEKLKSKSIEKVFLSHLFFLLISIERAPLTACGMKFGLLLQQLQPL